MSYPLIGNQKVSQLVELTANEIQLNDLLYIVDVSAMESKKTTVADISAFFEGSGSVVFAFNSQNAATASYIAGSNVIGSVGSSINSATASYLTGNVISASYAVTASYAVNGGSGNNQIEISGSSILLFDSGLNEYVALSVFDGIIQINASSGSSSGPVLLVSASSSFQSNTASYLNGNQNFINSDGGAIISDTFGNLTVDGFTARNNIFCNAIFSTYEIETDGGLFYTDGSGNVYAVSFNGPLNGTASYALNCATASYVNLSSSTIVSSSYANQAGGLAISNIMYGYGMVNAYTQSLSSSQIDTLIVDDSSGLNKSTMIEAKGNSILYFTSSVLTNYSFSLTTLNRFTGQSSIIDSTNVALNTNIVPSNWNNSETGSINLNFDLIAQPSLYGNYTIEVTSSSPNLVIDPTRLTKFVFSSTSNNLTTQPDELVQFLITPTSSVLINFSSSAGGPFKDYLPGLLITGSQNITWLDVHNQGVTGIRYTWECGTLTHLNCNNNSSLTSLPYSFPNSLTYLSCNSCSLSSISNLNFTSTSYFDCSNNNLSTLPQLSISTSYFNCSYNSFQYLPPLPYMLQTLYAQSSSLVGIPFISNNLITASFSNTLINSLQSPLPLSMSYLDISYTNVSTMSYAPVSMSYLNLASASFNQTSLTNVTTQLINNGMLSGTLGIQGYGSLTYFSSSLISNLNMLQINRDWTILHD